MLATYDPTPLYDHAETEEKALMQLIFVFLITFTLRLEEWSRE